MKVAIVNDSKMAAEILRRILASLPDFTLADAVAVAEKLRAAIAADPLPLRELRLPVTMSIGVTEFRRDNIGCAAR